MILQSGYKKSEETFYIPGVKIIYDSANLAGTSSQDHSYPPASEYNSSGL
jgi:hypothetical protein